MSAPFLVLTDFTPAADNALNYAAALAAPLGTSLLLLHVRRESLLDSEAFTGRIQHMSEGEIAVAFAERTQPLNVPVQVETAVEGVKAAVQDAVVRYQPALVILGKPATDKTPDELVSSTSLALLRATTVPLLVVPALVPAIPPTRFLLASDGHAFQLNSTITAHFEHLLTLAPGLTVAYVAEPEENDSCAASLESVRRSGLNAEPLRPHSVRHMAVPQGILQAAAETQSDLLTLVARRHSFLGQLFNRSVSAQVILHSSIPVLLLPSAE